MYNYTIILLQKSSPSKAKTFCETKKISVKRERCHFLNTFVDNHRFIIAIILRFLYSNKVTKG